MRTRLLTAILLLAGMANPADNDWLRLVSPKTGVLLGMNLNRMRARPSTMDLYGPMARRQALLPPPLFDEMAEVIVATPKGSGGPGD